MNRIEFVQSIIRKDRSMVEDVVDFFDHEMFLYELVGASKQTIYITDCTSKNISFQIDGNKQDIHRLTSYLSTVNRVVEYDKPLEVQYKVISDKSITIDIGSLL